jgi:hypothetical protein
VPEERGEPPRGARVAETASRARESGLQQRNSRPPRPKCESRDPNLVGLSGSAVRVAPIRSPAPPRRRRAANWESQNRSRLPPLRPVYQTDRLFTPRGATIISLTTAADDTHHTGVLATLCTGNLLIRLKISSNC